MGELEQIKANRRLLAVFLGFVGLSLVVTVIVFFFYDPDKPDYEKSWDWLIAVGGTLVSFVLGLAAGLLHLNRQVADTQKNRRERLCHLLIVEFEDALRVLGANSNEKPTLTSVHPLVVEEAIKSGLFNHELTKDMLRLAKTYHRYNDHLLTLRAARERRSTDQDSRTGTDEILQEVKKKTREVLRALTEDCGDVGPAVP